MHDYQQDFIALSLEEQVLCFGEFELKSGRHSPYFFNAGKLRSGAALKRTGQAYAKAIKERGPEFDMLLGPAYKGIPLVTTTAIAWHELYAQSVPVVYNRKESKQHGEGGVLVGGPMVGRVLIVDDVITAGTAVREVVEMIAAAPEAELAGIVVGLDRQERGQSGKSAMQELAELYKVPVFSIFGVDTLLDYLQTAADQPEVLARIEAYRAQYGV